ncbi:MAG: dihydroxyacetone kinase subunit L [Propionibacteriaceae bacterium]|jgi:dihydroxyacetone kinase phosphoprotein-dependent L subunit|nr:dihydroxyacetone kinase subunit L [Propionibacteriaceae bacterium]
MPLNRAGAAAWLAAWAQKAEANVDYLTDLDRQIGDADHGANLKRGLAAVTALDPDGFAGPADYLKKTGLTLVSTVGGASGLLYGTFFLRVAAAWPSQEGDAAGLGAAFKAGLDDIQKRGKAVLGDKTMVDALVPAFAAYDAATAAGQGIGPALAQAAAACAAGRDATVPLIARKGRASYLGERSAGHLDPGAASATYLVEAAASTLP